jgi:superfamily I DNA/RNA helicase
MANSLDHLDGLNPEQRAAATADAPRLVIAGAGSGKTETLARRVVDLVVRKGAAPDRILCITFTQKAGGEMRARLARRLPEGAVPRWVGTFHAVMARLLLEDGMDVPGVPRGFAILDPADARGALAAAIGERDMRAAAELQEALSILRNHLIEDPRRVPATPAFARFTPEVLARAAAALPAYRAELVRREALDMDDLIVLPVAAMRASPSLAARWSGRFAEILVDEYQDTNHAQHALVRLLAGEARRLFAVGDDGQGIYGWRGAEIAHIRRFRTDYPSPEPIRLETNYRSTRTILSAANHVIAQDREAIPKTLRPARPEADAGMPIAIRENMTPDDEGSAAVNWVQAMRRREPETPFRGFAVLVRAGFIAEPILDAFRDAGIPAQQVAEKEPEAPREVLAAIAWLRLAVSREAGPRTKAEAWDPAADDAFRRACAFPARGIGAGLFTRLREHAGRTGLALAASVGSLSVLPRDRQGLDAVVTAARRISDAVRSRPIRPSEALRLAAGEAGFGGRLSAPGPGLAAAWRAALAAADRAGSVQVFCEQAALGAAAAEAGEAMVPDAVQVMTLHRSKGLEFEHVLIAGCEEGVFPNRRAADDGSLPEERRLFYVGLTRAKRSVRFSWVRQRREWPSRPSRFLDDIPRHLLEGSPKPPADTGRQRRPEEAGGRRHQAEPGGRKPVPPPTQAEADRLVEEFLARRRARNA